MSRLHHRRVEFAEAAAFVSEHHRHHTPPVGHVFSLGAYDGDRLCGVAIIGRPVARGRDDGHTLEVTRLCTDGTRNAASFLLGRAARAAHALVPPDRHLHPSHRERGEPARGGLRVVSEVKGRSWDTGSRPRTDKHPTTDKLRWEPALSDQGRDAA